MKKSDLFMLLLVGLSAPAGAAQETAVLAGGCFWCIEADFEKLEGVTEVVSGYTGGRLENPGYRQVSAGGTGHVEAVRISYDPDVLDYGKILDHFWRHIDPTRDDGQFCDRGEQYRPVIFYADEVQRKTAEASRRRLETNKPFAGEIRVPLLPAGTFYPAEDYHQDYYKKNPLRYKYYRYRCGRDERVEALWGAS